jgi:CheY-like chemotaxis protein
MEVLAKPMLLIAEDNAEPRDIYRTYLSWHGYVVQTASDGLDCLNKLSQAMPVVLVLNQELRWGGSDGVLACLREESTATGYPSFLWSRTKPGQASLTRSSHPP